MNGHISSTTPYDAYWWKYKDLRHGCLMVTGRSAREHAEMWGHIRNCPHHNLCNAVQFYIHCIANCLIPLHDTKQNHWRLMYFVQYYIIRHNHPLINAMYCISPFYGSKLHIKLYNIRPVSGMVNTLQNYRFIRGIYVTLHTITGNLEIKRRVWIVQSVYNNVLWVIKSHKR